jgi:hypothetical protein
VMKGPAADATNAPQPKGLLCNPVMKMISFFLFFQVMDHRWNEIDRGKPKYWGTNLSQCHFAHHKWTGSGSKPGHSDERPATKRLSHGTAYVRV